ncbi:helix-turn-helix domain-containing protein [Streptomyces sp. NPDC048442]|uniref:helix-turn-helix domain-containing protein n=1 Tax=Streptomyces sp. NPDC048442 TaxID=3154823 RepID=UPI00342C83FC
MTITPGRPGKYADFEALREQAVALRREGLSLRQIRDRLEVFNNDVLYRLVQDEPPPEWTKRPRAKDDVRATARELRLQGMTYTQIQTELGCSKSSISTWVRDLPRPDLGTPADRAKRAAQTRWEHERPRREEARRQVKQEAAREIGPLDDLQLHIAGVSLYWAEGTKDKAHVRRELVEFINSDPNVIRLFLRWLTLVGVGPERLRCRVSIHETADVPAAEEFWAELVGIPREAFSKPVIKKHNPKTVRKNTGDTYRGCLVIRVTQSAELYRRIEGWWYGIVLGSQPAA